jgi:chemotaxis protein MotB
LKRKKQPVKEEGHKVPAYIVTFSDMTTLLLTFFVMLLSLATMQDPELIRKGRDSFRFSLNYLGLGLLLGREEKAELGSLKIKYSVPEPEESAKGRNINAKEEKIRRIYKKVTECMNVMPLEGVARKDDFTVTDIRFASGDARLNKSAKQFLDGFCSQLQQNYGSRPIKLYVLGFAADRSGEKEQWMLSARRAKAVANYMRDIISSQSGLQTRPGAIGGWSQWSLYWWGGGPGGDWVRRDSPISRVSQILIAVVRVDD